MGEWQGIVVSSETIEYIYADTEEELMSAAEDLIRTGLAEKVILGGYGASYGYIDSRGYHPESDC